MSAAHGKAGPRCPLLPAGAACGRPRQSVSGDGAVNARTAGFRTAKYPLLDMPFVDMRTPIGPHVGADVATAGADHAATQRPHRQVIGEVLAAQHRAVMASARAAIDEQIAATVAADAGTSQSYGSSVGPERLLFPPQRGLHLFATMAYSLDGTLDVLFAPSGFLGLVTNFPVLFCGYQPAILSAATLRFLRHLASPSAGRILFGFPHRRRVRVLAFDPIPRPAGVIR
jgi:hypothetical protein